MFNLFRKCKRVENTAARELYKTLSANTYTQYPYEKESLDEGMYFITSVRDKRSFVIVNKNLR